MPAPHRALRNSGHHQPTPDLHPNSLVKTPTPMPPRLSHFPPRLDPLHPPRRRKEISPRESPFLLKASSPAFLAARLCPTKTIMAALAARVKASAVRLLEISPEQTQRP